MSCDPATAVREGFARALAAIESSEQELARLDAVAGDGDHGMGMVRGLRAASAAAAEQPAEATAGAVVLAAGKAFSRAAGGASGALFGTYMTTVGRSLGDADPDGERLAAAFAEALAAVGKLGGARPGDKTMVDTLDPFVETFRRGVAEGRGIPDAWRAALAAARDGTDATAGMASKRGRAGRLGDRSLGERDPGAVSALLMLESFGAVLVYS